jgi:hypothetical protein
VHQEGEAFWATFGRFEQLRWHTAQHARVVRRGDCLLRTDSSPYDGGHSAHGAQLLDGSQGARPSGAMRGPAYLEDGPQGRLHAALISAKGH